MGDEVDVSVRRIVITGGPCAGKTTSMMRIKTFLEKRGFFVCIVPESATFLRTSGIRWTPADPNAFQKVISATQAQHEDLFTEFASTISQARKCNAVVLCDRGLVDGSVYVTEKMYNDCLRYCGLPELSELFNRYDCVLHLVTAASGAEAFYSTGDLRRESVEEAIDLDGRLFKAWSRHPRRYVFDNVNKSFEVKLRNMIGQLCKILKVPNTSKVPKRFLLQKFPEIPDSVKVTNATVRKIYLTEGPEDIERSPEDYTFIRERITDDNSVTRVMKRVTEEEGQRIERKQVISARQFDDYMMFQDPLRHLVEQKRVFFSLESTDFEICEYVSPSSGLLLLNVHPAERDHQTAEYSIPEWLGEVKDVSEEFAYSAHYLSLKDPTPLKPYTRYLSNSENGSRPTTPVADHNGLERSESDSSNVGGCF